jgi:phosphoglycolate phosphatase
MYTRQQLVDKMKKLGDFEFTDLTQVYTASYVAAMYAKHHHPDAKKVYAVGAPVLAQEFVDMGYETLSSQEHNEKYGLDYHSAGEVPFDQDVDLVVLGYDDKINLYKMAYASYAIQNNATFLCTNGDLFTMSPIGQGMKFPGNGTFLKALETCSTKTATITGKPNPFCFDSIVDKHGLDRSDILFIGDNLLTDIKFSNTSSVDSFLVLTGVTRPETMEQQLQHENAGIPTYIGENLDYN